MIVWLVVGLIAALIGGCAKTTVLAPKEAEAPKYGGVVKLGYTTDTLGFDDAKREHYGTRTLMLTNEEIWTGDWTKGRAGGYGEGKCDWFLGGSIGRLDYGIGELAEKVDILRNEGKLVLHLRKDVRWHNKPPTNGREMNADDVVASLERHRVPPFGAFVKYKPEAVEGLTISKLDDYTVVIKFDPLYFADMWACIDYVSIFPKDALDKFGDMTDWRNSIGTGPFILAEYVAGNRARLVRNPDYWGKDPIGPGKGNQLPYIDEVNMLVVPDTSTLLAAFRTGKVDVTTMGPEDAQEFVKNPRLKYVKYVEDSASLVIYMRTDKKDSPFSDKRVRQALMLGLNNQKILDELYLGEGTLHPWPLVPVKEYQEAYVPLENLPKQVRELYEYHPDEAKRLLAEAGYPNGFKAKIVCWNYPAQVDVLSMVKADWAKIGVEVELEPKDYAGWTAIGARRAYDDMLAWWFAGCGNIYRGTNWSGASMWNASYVDDPVLNKARDDMLRAFPDETKANEIHRKLMPYLLEQAYVIPLPRAYTYRFWWPWVKNYSGEGSIGYWNAPNWVKYVWIDQELKRSIIGE